MLPLFLLLTVPSFLELLLFLLLDLVQVPVGVCVGVCVGVWVGVLVFLVVLDEVELYGDTGDKGGDSLAFLDLCLHLVGLLPVYVVNT